MKYPNSYEDIPSRFLKHRVGFEKIGSNLFSVTFKPIQASDLEKMLKSKKTIAQVMKERGVTSTWSGPFSKLWTRKVYTKVTDQAVVDAYLAGEKALKAEIRRWQKATLLRRVTADQKKLTALRKSITVLQDKILQMSAQIDNMS